VTGDASGSEGGTAAARVTVVAGNPTEVELAAAHAVIAAALAEQHERGVERVQPPVDLWSSRAHAMRQPLTPGPGAWAASRGRRG
jgi:hypothetical protein